MNRVVDAKFNLYSSLIVQYVKTNCRHLGRDVYLIESSNLKLAMSYRCDLLQLRVQDSQLNTWFVYSWVPFKVPIIAEANPNLHAEFALDDWIQLIHSLIPNRPPSSVSSPAHSSMDKPFANQYLFCK